MECTAKGEKRRKTTDDAKIIADTVDTIISLFMNIYIN